MKEVGIFFNLTLKSHKDLDHLGLIHLIFQQKNVGLVILITKAGGRQDPDLKIHGETGFIWRDLNIIIIITIIISSIRMQTPPRLEMVTTASEFSDWLCGNAKVSTVLCWSAAKCLFSAPGHQIC